MDSLVHKELGGIYEEFMLALKRQDAPDATREEATATDKERPGKASNRDWESPTDPDARVMQHTDKHTHLSYHVDATVDRSITGRGVSISHDDDSIQQNRERVHHPGARPLMMIRRQRGEAPFGYFKQFGG